MTDHWADALHSLLDEVWRRLEDGQGAARHPCLATLGRDGPEARTVVLRGADRAQASVEIHSDAASSKIAQLDADPRAALLIWDADASLQTRLRLRVDVLTGAAAEPVWRNVPDAARDRYGGDPAPGAALAHPADHTPAPDPARFAVLRGAIQEIDALHLGRDLHRRALFTAADGFAGRWIAP